MIVLLASGNECLVMSESAQEAEIRASLGLHRGRRVLVGALVVVLAAVGLSFVAQQDDTPAVEALPVVVEAEAAPTPKPVRPPRTPGRRRARAAQVSAVVEAPRRAVEAPVAPPAVEPPPEAEPAPVAVVPVVDAEPPRAEPPPPEPVAAAEPPPPAPVAEETDGPPPAPPAEEPAWDGNGAAIARAIADAKRAAVRSCFENELKQQPKLEGTVVVELDLAPPNRVEGLRVTDDLNRPAFTRCVTSAMQSIRFSSLDEEISVRVPYVLSPERK